MCKILDEFVYLASAVKTCYLNILETIHCSGLDMWKGSPIQYLNSEIVTPICISLRVPFFLNNKHFFHNEDIENFSKI